MSRTAIEIAILAGVVLLASYADLKLFGRDGLPTFRSAVRWSIGWVVVAVLAGLVIWADRGGEAAVLYYTVYLIERSLSIDNVFVFLLLFGYFNVPPQFRPRLVVIGILVALAMRGLAIVGGIELLDRFDFLIYVLGVLLFVLAIRVYTGIEENADPDRNLMVRFVRRLFPVETGAHDGRWFLRVGDRLHTTPVFLCLAGLVFADLVFAIDSIPAAFAITRDGFIIWAANVFALLGLRSLLVLVERLIEKFRYLDETIAVVLASIAVKLITEEAGFWHAPPEVSLAIVAAIFAIGIAASVVADRRDRAGGAGPPTTA